MRLYPKVPHPFVIEPPLLEQEHFPKKSQLSFNLVLIGHAIQHFPYFVYTFREMGSSGIGKNRGRYSLLKVSSQDENQNLTTLYSHENPEKIITDFHIISNFSPTQTVPSEITLYFLTPLRIKSNERLSSQLPFSLLLSNLLRRISALSYFHCNEKLILNFKELIQQAKSIKIINHSLYWRDWQRYSSRQNTKMALGGLIGKVSYSGELSPFWHYLKIGGYIHAGKATTFGLGKYFISSAI